MSLMNETDRMPTTAPTVNVNLTRTCACGAVERRANPSGHFDQCAAKPILIPCPIPPTFECTVALGMCSNTWRCVIGMGRSDGVQHGAACPARPIRVACTIGGDGTWAGSNVTDIEPATDADGDDWGDAMWRACRGRWELVKALVLNTGCPAVSCITGATWLPLARQRDAMYSALAEMARAEEAAFKAQDKAMSALQDSLFLAPYHDELPENRPSARMLERYVERLIEQVGVLP